MHRGLFSENTNPILSSGRLAPSTSWRLWCAYVVRMPLAESVAQSMQALHQPTVGGLAFAIVLWVKLVRTHVGAKQVLRCYDMSNQWVLRTIETPACPAVHIVWRDRAACDTVHMAFCSCSAGDAGQECDVSANKQFVACLAFFFQAAEEAVL
jgi:hypothetical protein